MSSQRLNLKLSGLYTNPNQFSEIPQGALSKADNCVIDKGGVIESRRGFEQYGDSLGATIQAFHTYRDRLFVCYDDDKLAYDSDGAGDFIDLTGTYTPPIGWTIRSAKDKGNFYFTTDDGIKKIESLGSNPVAAGIPQGLDGEGVTTGASGFLQNNSSIAYRILWGIVDGNNNLLLGAPSGRLVISHTGGGTRDVDLIYQIPDGITIAHFFQVYRSQQVSSSVEPSDELYLVYEANPTAGEISSGELTFTDIVPDELLGALLYTSSSQEGILQANNQPPVAKEIALYKNMMFFGNTEQKERLTITLIAVDGTGFVVDDTITIDGVVYTGKATETPASGEFEVFTSGTASENIENTALSLCRVINQYASNTTIYAYYSSGFNELPGKILLEERAVGGSSFSVTSSNGTAFNPVLPTSGTSVSSTDDSAQNRVYYSKPQQPEAVPLVNFLNVGSSDFAIERMIPLRDSVFIFKQDGIFRIIGEDPSTLRLSVFDNTTTIRGINTAVEISNTIFLYSEQGVIMCSDNGIQVMSRPIEDLLFQIENFTNFISTAHSIAYESDRKFIFFMKTVAGDTYATQAYVYNQFTNAWTRWVKDATAGIVLNQRLYLASPDGQVLKERKDYSLTDYVDEEYDITITSSSGTTVNYTGTVTPEAGWLLKQGSTEATVVTVGSGSVVVDSDENWTASSAIFYKPIETIVEWAQESCGNPGILKHFREITLIMRESSFENLQVGFSTNLDLVPEYVDVKPELEGGWGSFPWGSLPWGGGGTAKPIPIRTYIPTEKARGSWIYIRVRNNTANTNFAISGVSLIYTPMSERFV